MTILSEFADRFIRKINASRNCMMKKSHHFPGDNLCRVGEKRISSFILKGEKMKMSGQLLKKLPQNRSEDMMETNYITDSAKLLAEMSRFTEYVRYRNREKYGIEDSLISFRDTNGFLGIEEDYKLKVAEDARAELQSGKWKESWIGTGQIAACAVNAVDKASNLIDFHNHEFLNKLDKNHEDFDPGAEKVIYDIYRGTSDKEAFARAVDLFGGRYDLIAFLFFIKDDTRYLPIRSRHFDDSFKRLGIDYSMSRKCNWENYQGYISIISAIRNEMQNHLPVKENEDIRLVDAHSFAWIIQEDAYIKWNLMQRR